MATRSSDFLFFAVHRRCNNANIVFSGANSTRDLDVVYVVFVLNRF